MPTEDRIRKQMAKGSVVFFGAGGGARAFCERTGDKPDFFVDNDTQRWGQLFLGVKILSPADLIGMQINRLVITSGYVGSVLAQLAALGIPRDKCEVPSKHLLGDSTIFADAQHRKSAAAALASLMSLSALPGKIVALGGAALGFYRDSDFIHWDSDVDLIAPLQGKDLIIKFLGAAGWEPREVSPAIMGLMPVGQDKKVPVSIVFYDLYESIYEDKFDQYIWEWPIEMFTNGMTINVHKCALNIPSPIEYYLERVYGKSWRTPRKNYSYLDYAQDL